MTEERKPSQDTPASAALDSVLDLFVFAPLGLAMTAAEELPKLAAKGRAQVAGQLNIAKVLGQFAVSQGRREVERRLRPTPGPPSRPAPRAADTNARPYGGTDADSPASATTAPDPVAEPPAEVERFGANGSAGGPEALSRTQDSLAIPGYDSLSASQVIQRLASLSTDELAAVGEYESAHRGRRTVLNRVRQLQGG